MNDLTRRYLFQTRPLNLETLDSYSARLLDANFATEAHRRHLTRISQAANSDETLDAATAWSNVVYAKTGRDMSRLRAGGPALVHADGTSCPNCARGITERYLCTLCAHGATVLQHPHFEANVCITHHRWVGPSTHPNHQSAVGNELVRAELEFRKLLRGGRIDAPLYFAHRRILAPIAVTASVSGAAADILIYPLLITLTRIMTSVDFSRRFFDPNHTFAEAFEYITTVVRDLLGEKHDGIVRSLWLHLRPAFLNIRESLDSGAPYRSASPHDFPIRPSIVSNFRQPSRPLEPFIRYLEPTGDTTLTSANHQEVLAHHGAIASTRGNAIATICRHGHRVDQTPYVLDRHAHNRTEYCGVCEHRILLPGFNDMEVTAPWLAAELHPTLNGSITAHDVFAGSSSMTLRWQCKTNATHTFAATPSNRSAAHSGCPLCLGRIVVSGVNDAETLSPGLSLELHPTKNGSVDLQKTAGTSTKLFWWMCRVGHTYRKTVANRVRGASCHHCATREAGIRTITIARPDLVPEWDHKRNFPRTPDDVKIGSKQEFYWICPKSHSYAQRPERRNAGYGCPSCSKRRLERGVNDAATRYPDITSEWHPYLNMIQPEDVLPGTTLYKWKCHAHGHVVSQSIPHRVLSHGCTACDPPERIRPPAK